MVRLVLVVLMYLISQVALSQTKFENGMQQALKLEQEGKLEEASNLYERIGNAEPTNWLPYYNLAQLKTRTTFGMKDNALIEAQLEFATNFANKADAISSDNSEIYVLKALINVAKIASNPMVYGASLSGETTSLYKRAIELNPKNPRAHSGLADFEMGGAKFFKQDLTPYCIKLQESLTLYDAFKPVSKLHPSWGKERALEALKDCGELKKADVNVATFTIKVTVSNVTSDKGTVKFALHSKKTFMKAEPINGKVGEINGGVSTIVFEYVTPGEYAILCYHDLNNNNKMDFDDEGRTNSNGQRMPLEDYGASNNVMRMGPPNFEDAKFIVENKSVDLTIRF